jgi:hypothetical protein
VAWAATTVTGEVPPSLMLQLAARLAQLLPPPGNQPPPGGKQARDQGALPQHAAAMLHALACTHAYNGHTVDALCGWLAQRAASVDVRTLASCLYAVGELRHWHAQLIEAATAAVTPLLPDARPQDVANLSKAAAVLGLGLPAAALRTTQAPPLGVPVVAAAGQAAGAAAAADPQAAAAPGAAGSPGNRQQPWAPSAGAGPGPGALDAGLQRQFVSVLAAAAVHVAPLMSMTELATTAWALIGVLGLHTNSRLVEALSVALEDEWPASAAPAAAAGGGGGGETAAAVAAAAAAAAPRSFKGLLSRAPAPQRLAPWDASMLFLAHQRMRADGCPLQLLPREEAVGEVRQSYLSSGMLLGGGGAAATLADGGGGEDGGPPAGRPRVEVVPVLASLLHAAGLRAVAQQTSPDGCLSIPLLVPEFRGRRVAVVEDTPALLFRNDAARRLGQAALRDRLLAAAGHAVLALSARQVLRLSEATLVQLLEAASAAQPAAAAPRRLPDEAGLGELS